MENQPQNKKITRRDMIKLMGAFAGSVATRPYLGLAAAALTGCTSTAVNRPVDIQPVAHKPELQPLIDMGAYSEPLYQEVIRAENDHTLSPSAKRALYAHLGSKAGEAFLQSGWEQVVIPQFLKEQGAFYGDDVKNIFRFKQRNGGHLYFDQINNRYLKIAAEGVGNDAEYLELAKNYYVNGWRAIKVPEETIAQVQLIKGFKFEGNSSVLLITPNMNQTLETYTSLLKGKNVPNANSLLSDLLERYYIDSLIPMNAVGVFQTDPNFKNICLSIQADETLKLIPIDLSQKPIAFERSLIFQKQYEELASRAARRSIEMPSYADFLIKHPDIASQVGLLENLGETVRINMSLPNEAQKVLIQIPQEMLGGAKQSSLIEKDIVKAITEQYGNNYKTIPQGQVFNVVVQTEAGEATVSIVKANALGDAVTTFGGKWAKLLEQGKAAASYVGGALFIMWIGAEVGQVIDPNYTAKLDSSVAFPDSLGPLVNANKFLGSIHNTLQLSKSNFALKFLDPNLWTPVMEQMFGLTWNDFRSLLSGGYMTEKELGQQFAELVPKAAFPPASSEITFQSPFPPLIPGAQYPMSAMFSAYTGEDDTKIVLFWAQTIDPEQGIITVPISECTQKPGQDNWDTVNLINTPWSVEFSTDPGNTIQFSCNKSTIDANTFELACKRK